MKRNTTTLVKTTERHRIELVDKDIIGLLRGRYDIPDGATVYVQVPGGGDWSNTSLDIDSSSPLIVTWTVEKTDGSI